MVVAPTKMINMPDKYATFQLKKDVFAKLMRGVTTLNLPDIAVIGDGKNIKLVATDKKDHHQTTTQLWLAKLIRLLKHTLKQRTLK